MSKEPVFTIYAACSWPFDASFASKESVDEQLSQTLTAVTSLGSKMHSCEIHGCGVEPQMLPGWLDLKIWNEAVLKRLFGFPVTTGVWYSTE